MSVTANPLHQPQRRLPPAAQPTEPRRYNGRFVYKYGSSEHLEWLKPIILENRLYFPTPRQLNDPAEARPPLTAASMNALIGTLGQLSAEAKPYLTNNGLARHAKILDFNARRFGTDLVLDRMAQSLYPLLETFHIYSLSKRPNNQHLWERYAGKHTGYCLEFLTFQPASEVRYSDIVLDITNDAQIRPFFLFYKASSWSREEEIRMITHRSPDATVFFNPRLLTRLILGREIAPADEETIRAWVGERNLPLTIVKET